MTTMREIKYKCSVCGTERRIITIMSTNAFGSPDLDLRPPNMQRRTMGAWLQGCPSCGYVSNTIEDPPGFDTELLKSEEYISCNGINFKAGLAKSFYKFHIISLHRGNKQDAFFALLHAAWVCDDKEDYDNAKLCRELALGISSELLASGSRKAANLKLIRADIMRRAGQFEELISEYSSVKFEGENSEVMNKVLAFQIEKAQQKDTSCYTIKDAVKDQE